MSVTSLYEEKRVQFIIADQEWKTPPGEVQYRLIGRETTDTLYNKNLLDPSNKIATNTLNVNGMGLTITGTASAGEVLTYDGANLSFEPPVPGPANAIVVNSVTYPITGTITAGGQILFNGTNFVAGSTAVPTIRNVNVSTTGELNATYTTPSGRKRLALNLAQHSIIDGVTLTVGMRLLVRDQTAAARNYIYSVTSIGATIIIDQVLDADLMQNNDTVVVTAGNMNSGAQYTVFVNGSPMSNNVTFARSSIVTKTYLSAGTYLKTSSLFVGEDTGYFQGTGGNNTFNTYVGYQAGRNTTTSSGIYGNTFIGSQAGFGQAGQINTFIGYRAGYSSAGSAHTTSIIIGAESGLGLSFYESVVIEAGTPTIAGNMDNSTIIGTSNFAETSYLITMYGYGNSVSNSDNNGNNIIVGCNNSIAGGAYNTVIGLSCNKNGEGSNNIVIGNTSALNSDTSILIGYDNQIVSGDTSVIIGTSIEFQIGVTNSVIIGNNNGPFSSALVDNAVCIGRGSSVVSDSIAIGLQCAASVFGGICIGRQSGTNSGVTIGPGSSSSDGITIGNGSSTQGGIAIGNTVRCLNNTMICLGHGTGSNAGAVAADNTFIGHGSGTTTTIGTGNTMLGARANMSTAASTDRIAIGRDVMCMVDSTAVLGAGAAHWILASAGGISTAPTSTQSGVYTMNPIVTKTNVGAITLTVDEFGPGNVIISTAQAGPETWTTPTAAAIIAKMPGAAVGMSYKWTLRNAGANTITLAAGAGITLGTGLYTTLTNTVTKYKIVVLTLTTVRVQRVGSYSL